MKKTSKNKPEITDEEIIECMKLHLTNVKYNESNTHFFATIITDNSRPLAVFYRKGIGRIYFAPRLGVVVPYTKYSLTDVEPFIQAQTSNGNLLFSDSYEFIDKRNKAAIVSRLKRMSKQIKDVLVELNKKIMEKDFDC